MLFYELKVLLIPFFGVVLHKKNRSSSICFFFYPTKSLFIYSVTYFSEAVETSKYIYEFGYSNLELNRLCLLNVKLKLSTCTCKMMSLPGNDCVIVFLKNGFAHLTNCLTKYYILCYKIYIYN